MSDEEETSETDFSKSKAKGRRSGGKVSRAGRDCVEGRRECVATDGQREIYTRNVAR